MEVNEELIKHIAGLARINLSEEEVKEFQPQLKEVIDAFDKLGEISTEGVEPSFLSVNIKNSLREDTVEDSLSQEEALKNSEHKKDGYFMGPKAI